MPEPRSGPGLALSDAEIVYYLSRCPPEHRWAFGAYLRGERDLAGDPLATGHAAEEHIASTDLPTDVICGSI